MKKLHRMGKKNMARHDPELVKAQNRNRAAIARATNPLFAIRQEKRAKIQEAARRFADEAAAEGRRIDYEAYVRETARIEREYLRREMAL